MERGMQEREQTLTEKVEQAVKICEEVEAILGVIARSVGAVIVSDGLMGGGRGIAPANDTLRLKIDGVLVMLRRICEHGSMIRDLI